MRSELSPNAGDLEDKMKWWSTYEPMEYSYFARPYSTYKSYIQDVFQPLERLQRSASAVRFIYQRDVEPGYMPKSRSASSLSPSHALPADDRVAHRYVPLIASYKPKGDGWRRQYEFSLKSPNFTYTKPHKSIIDQFTPPDIFEEFFSYKRREAPSKIYRPVSLTRWQYGGAYASGKLGGADIASPYRYPNYDSADDRPYMRRTFQARSYGVPYPYRQYMRQYEGGYDPKRVLITYVTNDI